LLQAPATGLDNVKFDAVSESVVVCNAYGHQIAVAEYCIFSMLACAHAVLKNHRESSAGHWCWSGVPSHPRHAEVYGATVCLIGLGRIGRETARRAKALGMHVLACNRTTAATTPDVDELSDLSHIAECVSRADFVIVNCAMTAQTQGIISGGILDRMKKTAFIINVSRGPLIEEAALYHALKSGRIAGAVLDVWYQYPTAEELHPRPSAFPFHELDTVIKTPHISG
jgi:phosphoglycerate dehydrogenase-like enzyme